MIFHPFENDRLLDQSQSIVIVSAVMNDGKTLREIKAVVSFDQDLNTGKISGFLSYNIFNYTLPVDEQLICATPDLDFAISVYNEIDCEDETA